VTILVATFGGDGWVELAEHRAIPSARRQCVPVIHQHGASLHEARNAALAEATTEWVIYLDADDQLEPDYVDTMLTGSADVRAPSVRYVQGGYGAPPRVPTVWNHSHMCTAECLVYGNWIVVGALARRQLLLDVGGWRDFTWSEDWDLWLRCHLAGASFEAIPEAVYRAHVRPHSRNRQDQATRLEAHRAIARANGVPIP
jgi:glycosyltransferase involved in cell wall biosynthesis